MPNKKRTSKSRPKRAHLPSVYQLTRQSISLLASRWKLFAGLLVVYCALTVMLVGGFSLGENISDLQADLRANTQSGAEANRFSEGLDTFFVLLLSGSAASNEASGIYQFVLLVICSLASVWALRQVQAGKNAGVKQAFYQGMYPLIPFLLLLLLLVIQLLPLIIGNFIYTIVVNGGIATLLIEKVIWGLLAGLLAFLSLYMLTSTVMALYIVTLPNMQPMQAIRSAREVVKHRRLLVMRKILALPILLLILLAVVVVPLIIGAQIFAEGAFFVLSTSLILLVHSYLYSLYRELL